MEEAVQLKFDQHPQLNEQLLATRDWNLVEKTNDSYWVTYGKIGNGLNKLGKLLERVRENSYIQKNILTSHQRAAATLGAFRK